MHKPLSPLHYLELYEICEEVLQLKGAFLQNVVCQSVDQYFLQFFKDKQTHWLVFNLSPSNPFFLSTNSANPVKYKKLTPILNFLKSHFKGRALTSIEIASKPNRVVRLIFGEDVEIIFKCFPHGQGLLLKSENKTVIYPPGKFTKNEEFIFLEPELKSGWEKNYLLQEKFKFLLVKEQNQESDKKISQQLKKIEKNITHLELNKNDFELKTNQTINELETKTQSATGPELNALYLEIKKLKRRLNEYGQKKNLLLKKKSFIQSHPELFNQEAESTQRDGGFNGTKVFINDQFQLWVGRRAEQNDELIRLASPHELWIHLRDRPSAHGLIRGPKKLEPSREIVDFCCLVVAQLTAGSKKMFLDGEKIEFIIAPKKYLKKTKSMAPGSVIVEREKVRRIAFKKVEFQILD